MTRAMLPFRTPADHAAVASRAAAHLAAGGLLAHPTETVYGVGCALRGDALARLGALKGREGPFLVLVEEPPLDSTDWSAEAARLAEAFWPGPLTLIVRAREVSFPAAVLGPGGTLAVRVTAHPGLLRVVRELGSPVTSTSANERGAPPVTSLRAVQAVLDTVDPGCSVWLLDGGDLPRRPPSTLLDCTTWPLRLRRAGAIPLDALREVVDGIEES